jgi:hypothetical protein
MILPCTTCKSKKVDKQGPREFVGCDDKIKHDKNFHYDNYFYHHSYDAYEKEAEQDENNNGF